MQKNPNMRVLLLASLLLSTAMTWTTSLPGLDIRQPVSSAMSVSRGNVLPGVRKLGQITPTFVVGEVVRMRDDGDWYIGMVTKTDPLKVKFISHEEGHEDYEDVGSTWKEVGKNTSDEQFCVDDPLGWKDSDLDDCVTVKFRGPFGVIGTDKREDMCDAYPEGKDHCCVCGGGQLTDEDEWRAFYVHDATTNVRINKRDTGYHGRTGQIHGSVSVLEADTSYHIGFLGTWSGKYLIVEATAPNIGYRWNSAFPERVYETDGNIVYAWGNGNMWTTEWTLSEFRTWPEATEQQIQVAGIQKGSKIETAQGKWNREIYTNYPIEINNHSLQLPNEERIALQVQGNMLKYTRRGVEWTLKMDDGKLIQTNKDSQYSFIRGAANCQWSDSWGACNAACGQAGTQTRSKSRVESGGGTCNAADGSRTCQESCPCSTLNSSPCQSRPDCQWRGGANGCRDLPGYGLESLSEDIEQFRWRTDIDLVYGNVGQVVYYWSDNVWNLMGPNKMAWFRTQPEATPQQLEDAGIENKTYIKLGGDCPGNNIEQTSKSLENCKSRCDELAECKGFTYMYPWCYPKSASCDSPTASNYTFYEKREAEDMAREAAESRENDQMGFLRNGRLPSFPSFSFFGNVEAENDTLTLTTEGSYDNGDEDCDVPTCDCNYVGVETKLDIQYLCQAGNTCFNLVQDWCAEGEDVCEAPGL